MGSLLLRHDAASASVVRREIADDLRAEHISPDSVDDVLLVVGELVGNAVRHADGADLDVTWQLDRDCVEVRVNDDSPEQPRVLHAAPNETSGRGMAIVAALARDWGVQPLAHGKQVWAHVPVRRAG